jgi:hypothetical protein
MTQQGKGVARRGWVRGVIASQLSYALQRAYYENVTRDETSRIFLHFLHFPFHVPKNSGRVDV